MTVLPPIFAALYLALQALWSRLVFGPYAFAELRALFIAGVAAFIAAQSGVASVGPALLGRRVGTVDRRLLLLAFGLAAVLPHVAELYELLLAAVRSSVPGIQVLVSASAERSLGDLIVAPVTEELVFRGVVLASLVGAEPPRRGVFMAVVVSTVGFLATHEDLSTFRLLFVLPAGSVLYSWVFLRTRSVVACMAVHAAWNLSATVQLLS